MRAHIHTYMHISEMSRMAIVNWQLIVDIVYTLIVDLLEIWEILNCDIFGAFQSFLGVWTFLCG